MALNFVEALMQAKRRAQLQGRPISQQEVRGITEGFAQNATEANLRERGLGLQEKGLEEQKSQFGQTLVQHKYEVELERKTAEEAKEDEKKRAIATGVGAIGGAIGGSFIPGVGTLVGAAIGSAIGPAAYEIDPFKAISPPNVLSKCIIISSCTSPNSNEVQIAREYRDKFMTEEMLTGYYFLCGLFVPFILKYKPIKMIFKKLLVDRLIDYGEWRMDYRKKRKYLTSALVTRVFLSSCYALGRGINRYLEVQHGQ